ncbi:MAG: ACT domain-containing protein [Candidatus Gastranaerophilales bacterium]|nr:ACT domain-containing protein [Candidatus Gastranaerophilales bacterium]
MNKADNQVIITVSGTDKVGIVAGVSNKLLQHNVNIEDIKQTIMQDNFAMMMLCDISKLEVSFKEFKDSMMALGEELEMEIWVQKKDIFDKMHTV